MRNRGMVSIMLVLFAVLALSATGIYAEEQKSCAVLMHGTGSMLEEDDFAVSGNCEEIAYDDESAEECWSYTVGGGQHRLAVHFTRPYNYETLETARFNIRINGSVPSNSFNWSVLNWTGTEPGDVIASGTTTPTKDGWHDVDVGGISVPEDFVIAMRWIQGGAPCLGTDINSSANRSWDYPWAYAGYPWDHETEKNYMIRAVVCSIGEPDINVTPVAIDLELPLNGSSSETLAICNEGDFDLTYNISISCDTSEWLSVDKTETDRTVAPGNCDDRILTVDATGLESGNYSATVTISSNDPDKDENPVRVPVTLTVDVSGNCEEIAYDDGSAEQCWTYTVGGGQYSFAVHFTRPYNYETLETARFNIRINGSVPSNSFNWSVLNWTGTEPGDAIASGTTTPTKDGWHDVDMGGISVPEDFVIAMRWIQGSAPCLQTDNTSSADHSWRYPWAFPGYAWDQETEKNYMIRAVVCSGVEPDINVTPVAIDLELPLNGSSSETLKICNEGNEDLTYDISISCDTGKWLSVDKTETDGTVAPGNCDDRILTIDATGLESGNYSATVSISSNDPDKDENPVRVPVSLEVNEHDLMEGDANGDGCVSLKDSTMIKLYLVGRMDLNESQLKCADTWDDSEVTMKDSTLILKWLVDPSTKLWQSPEDDDMGKPVAC